MFVQHSIGWRDHHSLDRLIASINIRSPLVSELKRLCSAQLSSALVSTQGHEAKTMGVETGHNSLAIGFGASKALGPIILMSCYHHIGAMCSSKPSLKLTHTLSVCRIASTFRSSSFDQVARYDVASSYLIGFYTIESCYNQVDQTGVMSTSYPFYC